MKRIFEKGYIGSCQIKNRVVMTAMTTGYAGMDGKPLTLLPGHALNSACDKGVTLTKCEDGSSVFVEADHVVLALGTKARKDLVTAFEKEIDRVIPLGETLKTPGRVAVSLQDGYTAA